MDCHNHDFRTIMRMRMKRLQCPALMETRLTYLGIYIVEPEDIATHPDKLYQRDLFTVKGMRRNGREHKGPMARVLTGNIRKTFPL